MYCRVLIKLTVSVLHCIRLLFYLQRQLSTSTFSSILLMQLLTGQIVTLKNVFTRTRPSHLSAQAYVYKLTRKLNISQCWFPVRLIFIVSPDERIYFYSIRRHFTQTRKKRQGWLAQNQTIVLRRPKYSQGIDGRSRFKSRSSEARITRFPVRRSLV